MEGPHRTLGVAMIDEAKRQAESEKLVAMVNLAMDIDVEYLKAMRPEVEFLSTVLGGWLGDMFRTAMISTDAFLEYRAKLDVIIEEMGLDMLLNLGKGEHPDA
jgi:hypothetical protein